jgi:protein-disulfide isomerase
MKKNKNFIIISVIAMVALFAAMVFLNKEEMKADAVTLADPALLIREHSFVKGPADAKVTLVEFFDPECEACKAMHPIVDRLYSEYNGKIRVVYRYTPFHTNSLYASSVLEEAKEQGKYEEALTALFDNQPVWGSHHEPKPELIPGYMEKLGLQKKLFEKDAVIAKHKAKIEIDQKDSNTLLVSQTPTFFVNGRKLYNIGYDYIKMAIEDSLQETK